MKILFAQFGCFDIPVDHHEWLIFCEKKYTETIANICFCFGIETEVTAVEGEKKIYENFNVIEFCYVHDLKTIDRLKETLEVFGLSIKSLPGSSWSSDHGLMEYWESF